LPRDLPPSPIYPGCITAGLLEAAAGDLAGAIERLRQAREAPLAPIGWEDDGRVLLESWIASSQGRWSQAAHLLEPASLRGYEFLGGDFPGVGTHAVNWFRGRALENCGQADSAISCYERALSRLAAISKTPATTGRSSPAT
jgi:tetratricopeptide (TPR) repeat protein